MDNDNRYNPDIFEDAVKNFLRENKMNSLRDIFSGPEEMYRFFSHPIINGHLTRHPSKVKYNEEGEPDYSPSERLLYELCMEMGVAIPYRSEGSEFKSETLNRFYDSGTSGRAHDVHDEVLVSMLSTLPKRDDFFVHIIDEHEAYELNDMGINLHILQGDLPNEKNLTMDGGKPLELDPQGTSLFIFPTGLNNEEYNHALTVAAVMDNKSHKVKAVLVVNSTRHKSSFEDFESLINAHSDSAELSNECFHVFNCGIDVQYRNDDRNCGLYRFHNARALLSLAYNKPEVFHELAAQPWKQSQRYMKSWQKAQIDGHLLAQQEINHLYGRMAGEVKDRHNIQAGHTNRHYRLSPTYNSIANRVGKEISRQMLPYLPEYFNRKPGGRTRKPLDQIYDQNLETRWRTGTEYLKSMVSALQTTEISRE